MTAADLTGLLRSGEELYNLLLSEAESLLRNFDTNGVEDFEHTLACRERMIASLDELTERISSLLSQEMLDDDAASVHLPSDPPIADSADFLNLPALEKTAEQQPGQHKLYGKRRGTSTKITA